MPVLIPGPEDKSILFEQENHISKEVWDGKEPEIARCIPWDPKNDSWTLNTRMRQYIRRTGLHHFSEIEKMKIDHALISGHIERWRPETNTFHFLGGEATVTLEDVAYIYGLPIDGPTVTGRVWSHWMILEEKFLDLLGVAPDPSKFQGGQINLKWFHDNFKDLPKRPSQAVEIRHTRAYLFHLVSSQICTNTSGSRGNAYLIELFEDFKPYAWGPACLANLYRSLTRASRIKDRVKTITGPLQPLQIWAYLRMSIGRSISKNMEDIQLEFPLFKMWEERLKDHHILTNVGEVRRQLDTQDVDSFDWQPYDQYGDELSACVNEVDRPLFRSAVSMINYMIVERHNVDRVLKQFGLNQHVPPPFHPIVRVEKKLSKRAINYERKYAQPIEDWNNRVMYVVNAENDEVSGYHRDQYLQWYRRITRNRIGRPLERVHLDHDSSTQHKVDKFLD
ncbi:serine/threonine-protein phosphatase 7 long form [Cinnamomum micranthum f. kanehirae]|uniref:Serine/threonine-protein phosphatase 7 long form n=1 Tax=Cinnamomum micranthum f. kanehirae TaxID=337451 RepID=A0A443PJZ1_9MAGN|nr:serine/threonine-protein phosphatase 7 long form [Cinnamomum micranthum f. kanehirae]